MTTLGRREFLYGLAGASAARLLGAHPVDAEPPPETSRIRLEWTGGACQAPKWVADELLRAEGFTVQAFHKAGRPVTSLRLKALASSDTDFDLLFAPDLVLGLEAGQPIVILAGLHVGCFELFGTERVRAIHDLKGKTIAVFEKGSVEHRFLTVILSYVGLNPETDVTWVIHSPEEAVQLLAESKIDAFLGLPPWPQQLRARKIGHVVLNSTTDRPWREYFCCMVAANREFVRKHPIATKRVIRALMKANDLCAVAPERAARLIVGKGDTTSYDYALQTMREVPYTKWREYDHESTIRFYALRLHEAGMIKSSPQKIIAQGTDWRFLNELKKELKG